MTFYVFFEWLTTFSRTLFQSTVMLIMAAEFDHVLCWAKRNKMVVSFSFVNPGCRADPEYPAIETASFNLRAAVEHLHGFGWNKYVLVPSGVSRM